MNAAAKRQNLAAVARRLVEKGEVVERRLFDRVRVEFDVDEWEALADALEQLEQLGDPSTRPRARRTDPPTSVASAAAIGQHINAVQLSIVRALEGVDVGSSARDLEQLGRFAGMAHGMVRKRVSELAATGWLEAVGVETRHGTTPATTYQLTPAAKAALL